MSYAIKLIEAGIAESRAYALAAALQTLNSELCKLDYHNQEIFMKTGITGHLSAQAKDACMMDVVGSVEEKTAMAIALDTKVVTDVGERYKLMHALRERLLQNFNAYEDGLICDWECMKLIVSDVVELSVYLPEPPTSLLP